MNTKSHFYKIDISRLQSDGDFPCPECGVSISPAADVTDTTYSIKETYVRDDEIEKVVLTCNKCGSKIELIGFTYVPPPRSKLEGKYKKLKPLYEQLVSEVKYVLARNLKNSDIVVHALNARVKSFDSFYEKVIRKEVREDPFTSINDVAAVRVICLYLKDLKRIGDMITKQFYVIEADTSRTRSEEPFGYRSDKYVISLPKEYTGARYDEIKNLKCEIQVRTILMHAWATVSHHLDYKKKIDIPSNLRKDFNALSGLFHVADADFERFRESVERARRKLEKSVKEQDFDLNQEINLDSLRAYLRWRLPERKRGRVDSTLLNSTIESGHTEFLEIDARFGVLAKSIIRIEGAKDIYGKNAKMSQADILRLFLSPKNLRKYFDIYRETDEDG